MREQDGPGRPSDLELWATTGAWPEHRPAPPTRMGMAPGERLKKVRPEKAPHREATAGVRDCCLPAGVRLDLRAWRGLP